MQNSREKQYKLKQKEKKKKQLIWTIKITIISFAISTIFGVFSQTAANNANVYILFAILLIFILVNIAFDGIALSATTCPISAINSMASQKVKHAKGAVFICKKSDKVASICADVIGDVAGILSGVCLGAIVLELVKLAKIQNNIQITIISAAISGVISAITIGGKAFMKRVAMSKNIQYVMFCARFISPFIRVNKKKKRGKNNNETRKFKKL